MDNQITDMETAALKNLLHGLRFKSERTDDEEKSIVDISMELAKRYLNGQKGCDKDIEQAIIYYTEAALHEEVDQSSVAQYWLGKIYSTNKSVKNKLEAVHWYTKAAENGNEEAKKALKEIGKVELPINYEDIKNNLSEIPNDLIKEVLFGDQNCYLNKENLVEISEKLNESLERDNKLTEEEKEKMKNFINRVKNYSEDVDIPNKNDSIYYKNGIDVRIKYKDSNKVNKEAFAKAGLLLAGGAVGFVVANTPAGLAIRTTKRIIAGAAVYEAIRHIVTKKLGEDHKVTKIINAPKKLANKIGNKISFITKIKNKFMKFSENHQVASKRIKYFVNGFFVGLAVGNIFEAYNLGDKIVNLHDNIGNEKITTNLNGSYMFRDSLDSASPIESNSPEFSGFGSEGIIEEVTWPEEQQNIPYYNGTVVDGGTELDVETQTPEEMITGKTTNGTESLLSDVDGGIAQSYGNLSPEEFIDTIQKDNIFYGISTGEEIDLSSIQSGYTDIYNLTNSSERVSLMTDHFTEVRINNFEILGNDGKIQHFTGNLQELFDNGTINSENIDRVSAFVEAKDGTPMARFTLRDIADVIENTESKGMGRAA